MTTRTTTFRLERVHYIPSPLEPGILYVAEEFDVAGHLCACGCGSKVLTPLGPTEWSVVDSKEGPSLTPSIGNWQIPCQSHYWISEGRVEWSLTWSPRAGPTWSTRGRGTPALVLRIAAIERSAHFQGQALAPEDARLVQVTSARRETG